MSDGFLRRGWARFPADPEVLAWVAAARGPALATLEAPEHAAWWRCGGTWFAGVNVLDNDAAGRVAGGPPLAGAALRFLAGLGLAPAAWDRGQISATRPGYPQPGAGESDSAFRYRLHRDAAHVDGLIATGPARRRHPVEAHGFILGLPLTTAPETAAPLVVWEGSHQLMAQAFRSALAGIPASDWPATDLTGAYHAARRAAFETCPRRPLPARPGEAVLLHRLALHGVAPWQAAAEGLRAIAYFRPELPDRADWLALP